MNEYSMITIHKLKRFKVLQYLKSCISPIFKSYIYDILKQFVRALSTFIPYFIKIDEIETRVIVKIHMESPNYK